MKKPKFKFVKQEEENGCAIACIAMILGKTYEEVAKSFLNDFNKSGVRIDAAVDYLSTNGVDVIRKGQQGYSIREENNKRMIAPFADIHFISFQQFVDSEVNHAVIMLKNGDIVCPTKNRKIDEISIYQIDDVLGCYYDK